MVGQRTGTNVSGSLPLTPGAFTSLAAHSITKLNSTGGLVYSSYLGGINCIARAVALDAAGNAYVTGDAAGSGVLTPGSLNPVQKVAVASGFVAKFSSLGTVLYSSQLGGATFATGIAVDAAGNAYVAGSGNGTNAEFATFCPRCRNPGLRIPATAGAFNNATPSQSWLVKIADTSAPAVGLDSGGAGLTFPDQTVNTTSAQNMVLHLVDAGSADLAISGITTTGDYAVTTSTCGASLAAASTCDITVSFTPTLAGARPGTLVITDSAAGSPHVYPLSGMAWCPRCH